MKLRTLAMLTAGLFAAAALAQTPAPNAYDVARHALKTTQKKGPSPQPFGRATPKGVESIRYDAPSGKQLAWLLRPPATFTGPRPVVVYAHGGFALGGGDDTDARGFTDAGFIVIMPTVRGENGNPGNFELFLGEVDDVIAAAGAVQQISGTDPERIYLFGHSIGGGLATMASLSASNPYKLVGTTGGNYTVQDCADIAREMGGTFDVKVPAECDARFPDAYMAQLKTPLFAYVGDKDRYSVQSGQSFKSTASASYHLSILPGDHFTVVQPSIRAFIGEIAKAG